LELLSRTVKLLVRGKTPDRRLGVAEGCDDRAERRMHISSSGTGLTWGDRSGISFDNCGTQGNNNGAPDHSTDERPATQQ
jgi:hypothetical protein